MADNEDQHALINEALILYLGGDLESPGVKPPWWHADRLKKVYPSSWESLYNEVLAIASVMDSLVIDWEKETLQTAMVIAKKTAKTNFPWLSDIAVEKLASFFAYQWR